MRQLRRDLPHTMNLETPTTTIMQANGIGSDPSKEHRYAAFYEQILRLQDEVLAGRHPRLKLSDVDIAQFKASFSSASVGSLPAVNGAANHASMDQHPLPS